MKILVIQHKAGDRFRTVQFYEALKAKGVEINDPHWSLKNEWRRYLEEAAKVDVVWIARRMLSFWKLRQLKKVNPHIVFDYDDALFMKSSRHGASGSFSKSWKFKTVAKMVKTLVAGNSFLADMAKKYVSGNKVKVIPTVVNRDWYQEKTFDISGVFRVGWLGSKSTLYYLQTLKPIFNRFNEEGVNWELVVISDQFPDWADLPMTKISWTLEDEKNLLPTLDLGLNPLEDDDWCRGKCAIKAIQYMAAGVAVAASPVGVNCALLDGGDHGWQPRSEDEWLKALKEAAQNRQDTFDKGQRAREWVWSRYTMEVQVDELRKIFEDTCK